MEDLGPVYEVRDVSNADVIVNRLFLASYDLGQFVDAVHWCDEGQRRFPTDFKFVRCQLWLMTSKAKEPDVALAWKLADSLPKVALAPERGYYKVEGRLATAAVLARAEAHVSGFAEFNFRFENSSPRVIRELLRELAPLL